MSVATPVRRALLSVSDKSGLEDFARRLAENGVTLVSTGGTAARLRDAGLSVSDVSDLTGFPEMMDGRVKTLHPKVHGGLLALRGNAEHEAAMVEHAIAPIDLLVVNLYPFEATVASGADYETAVENIDIGGPAMIRAAAKNHAHVGVVADPEDYDLVADELEARSGLTEETRRRLASVAFARTAAYDAAVSNWFAEQRDDTFPRRYAVAGRAEAVLRYGENPHQSAALYLTDEDRPGAATARQTQGKELSYNNLNDTDAAFELVSDLDTDKAAVAIIKHANPCGVAHGATLAEAYDAAHQCDPVSAFGGVVAVNRPLDKDIAEKITKIFTEVVIAPTADEDALALLGSKKNLRVLLTGTMPDPTARKMMMRPIAGGFLLQGRDSRLVTRDDIKVVTKRQPSDAELNDLLFAFRVAKHVKSNAIVYAKNETTVGIGAGQMSRVDSSRIAARKAIDAAEAAGLSEPLTNGSVVASDAFFPFADGMLSAIEAGATAVIQPGGSMRDQEVIDAADEAGAAMVFTGIRHFRH